MTFIDELKQTRGLIRDPENLKPVGRRITVFQRLAKEVANGKLGREIDQAVRKQAEVWSSRADQVVGAENF